MRMAEKSFRQALDETFGMIAEAVQRIEAVQNAETELHNLRAYIINALDLVEDDKRLAQGGDELYRAAAEFVGEVEIEIVSGRSEPHISPERPKALEMALEDFRQVLQSATPSEKARRMGLRDDQG